MEGSFHFNNERKKMDHCLLKSAVKEYASHEIIILRHQKTNGSSCIPWPHHTTVILNKEIVITSDCLNIYDAPSLANLRCSRKQQQNAETSHVTVFLL
ncbi:hypothetical protein CEXT_714641 [Caerostris extrusa]|uniref:Uncharacterized protein n=1 Tax=Caerostris extrusa TaxID=172846 RepID=A0AAV4PNU3_CAEEX|nr:hypothetical protein CEXT_714641 [Caerostris extrusa]